MQPAMLAIQLQCGACLTRTQGRPGSGTSTNGCRSTVQLLKPMALWHVCCWRQHHRQPWQRLEMARCHCIGQQTAATRR